MLSYVPDGLVVSVPVAGAEPSHRDHRADGGRRFHASRQLRAAAEGEKVRTDDTNRRRLDHAHVRFVRYTRSLAPVRCVLGVLSQTVYSHQIYMSVDVYHDHRSQKKTSQIIQVILRTYSLRALLLSRDSGKTNATFCGFLVILSLLDDIQQWKERIVYT